MNFIFLLRNTIGCGLASNKVYCYGGYPGYEPNTFVYTAATSDFFYIDLLSLDFKNFTTGADYWTPVSQPNNFVLEPNSGVAVASISNSTKLILSGGFGKNNTILTNSTTIYDPQTDTWTAVHNTLPYYAYVSRRRKMNRCAYWLTTHHRSSGVVVDVGDSEVFAWGGLV